MTLYAQGTSSVFDYSRKFKHYCDKLSAIGYPVDDTDKIHWFLYGLGASFEVFSTVIHNSKPAPSFRDLVVQAEGHELFLQTLYATTTPPVTFVSQQSRFSNNCGRDSSRGGNSRGFSNSGRGIGGRPPPHCQLC